MLFDSRTVYLGASRDKYEQYCKALDSEKIKYKTKRVKTIEKDRIETGGDKNG